MTRFDQSTNKTCIVVDLILFIGFKVQQRFQDKLWIWTDNNTPGSVFQASHLTRHIKDEAPVHCL